MNNQATKEFSREFQNVIDRSLEHGRGYPKIKPLEEEAKDFDLSLSLDQVIKQTMDIIIDDTNEDIDELNRYLERAFELQKEIFDSLDMDPDLKKEDLSQKVEI